MRLDQGHVVGHGGLPSGSTTPAARPRRADRRPRRGRRQARREAGRRAVRLSIARHAGLHRRLLRDHDRADGLRPGHRRRPARPTSRSASPSALGLLGIGIGAVHWAKTLMPDEEVVEERHPLRATDEARERRRRRCSRRAARSRSIARRPLIKYTPRRRARPLRRCRSVLQVAGDLGPLPGDELSHDACGTARATAGSCATPSTTADQGRRRHASARSSTSCPRALRRHREAQHVLEEKAKAAVLLMRLEPGRPSRSPRPRDWGYDGHRRLLQDLHPRRVPGRPVRAADAPPALPVPPVDLRRDRRTARSSSARPSARCRSCRSPSTTRATSSPDATSTKPVGPSFWERG